MLHKIPLFQKICLQFLYVKPRLQIKSTKFEKRMSLQAKKMQIYFTNDIFPQSGFLLVDTRKPIEQVSSALRMHNIIKMEVPIRKQ